MTDILLDPCSSLAILSASSMSSMPKPWCWNFVGSLALSRYKITYLIWQIFYWIHALPSRSFPPPPWVACRSPDAGTLSDPWRVPAPHSRIRAARARWSSRSSARVGTCPENTSADVTVLSEYPVPGPRMIRTFPILHWLRSLSLSVLPGIMKQVVALATE